MSKKIERVCVHCGEVVKDDVDICPYCRWYNVLVNYLRTIRWASGYPW